MKRSSEGKIEIDAHLLFVCKQNKEFCHVTYRPLVEMKKNKVWSRPKNSYCKYFIFISFPFLLRYFSSLRWSVNADQ